MHPFARSVKAQSSGSAVEILRPEGKKYIFNKTSNTYVPEADIIDKLVELFDTNNTRTGWQFTTSNKEVEIYDTTGNLLSISYPNGQSLNLAYSCTTDCQVLTPFSIAPHGGFLLSVTDNFGNSLNFTYNYAGQMTTMADPAGNIYRYSYDASGNLKTVTYPDDTPVDLADNPKKTYIYGSDAGELANTAGVLQPNALTGIIDENGVRYATYKYDATGKAISTEHANSVEKYALAYAPDGSSTAVTDPLGAIRTTHFTTILGVVKSTGTDQPGGSGCAAASSTMAYDANGNVASRTDFNGHKVCYAYDLACNLEAARAEGLPANADCAASLSAPSLPLPARKVATEWHPTFRLPTKVTEPGLETTYSYDSKGNTTHKGLKDLVTNKVRAWDTTYTYSATGILVQKAEDGPRTDVNDVVTYDYYPEDAACTGAYHPHHPLFRQRPARSGHRPQRPDNDHDL